MTIQNCALQGFGTICDKHTAPYNGRFLILLELRCGEYTRGREEHCVFTSLIPETLRKFTKNAGFTKPTAMESLLELMRRHHEERERLIRLMTEEFVAKKPTVRDQIYSEHRVKALLDVSYHFSYRFPANLCPFSNSKVQRKLSRTCMKMMSNVRQKFQPFPDQMSSPSSTIV